MAFKRMPSMVSGAELVRMAQQLPGGRHLPIVEKNQPSSSLFLAHSFLCRLRDSDRAPPGHVARMRRTTLASHSLRRHQFGLGEKDDGKESEKERRKRKGERTRKRDYVECGCNTRTRMGKGRFAVRGE